MASAVADCEQSPRNNNCVTPYSVNFQDFCERIPVHDRTISFTYQTVLQSVPQHGDWIGLFRDVGKNPEPADYVSYIGAKEGSVSLNNNIYKASLLLSNSEVSLSYMNNLWASAEVELDVDIPYQLIYVTTGCSIIGCSQSFWLRDGLCNVKDTSSSDVSSLVCKCCQISSKRQDKCSNDSSDNSCNISKNSSSDSLQTLHDGSRDFTAHGRLAFQNLSEWLAFMSNASRQKKKMHRTSEKSMDELWHTDPKAIANRSRNYERSDYTKIDTSKTSSNTLKVKFSMGDKNSLSVSKSKMQGGADVDKERDVSQTLLSGDDDCMDVINYTAKNKSRRLASDDYKKRPLMMIEETSSKDQHVRKSNSAEYASSEKIKPQSSSSSVDIFTEALHADDAFNALYLEVAESEDRLKLLTEELRRSALTVESQESEIKQYKTIMSLQTGELKKHIGTIQSQSLMLLQYREKMDVQLNELKGLREKTESSVYELKEEKEKNKLLIKELEEANGRSKRQSSELDMRCTELHSVKALADTLSKELNEVKEQELAKFSEMLLLKKQLEEESSDLKLLKDREMLSSAKLQHLRMEVELKSAELLLMKDNDKSQSVELKLLEDQLHTRSMEVSSLEETVQSQSLELMQLNAKIASLTTQVDMDRTALAESLNKLEDKDREIKQRRLKEEEQCLEIGQHQTVMESLLAEKILSDTKEKMLQDELKEISDAFQLCRAQEMQHQKDLDKCRTEEEFMFSELTLLRVEKNLMSDSLDQLKAAKEFLLSELHQLRSTNEQLLEECKMHEMSQEQTSSASFRARINAELLSRALEKLRSKEECSSDELKNSNGRLKAVSHELMLSREREGHLLEELAQLRACGKPLISESQDCHSSDEELQKILKQKKVNNSTLSSGLDQGLLNEIVISKEMSQTDSKELLITELEESRNAAELCSSLQQSKHRVEALTDEFQQPLTSQNLISKELKLANRKSLAADLESSLLVSKVKHDASMAELLNTRAKIIEDQKQMVTSGEVLVQDRGHAVIEEEDTSLNMKQLIENEEGLSAECRHCSVNDSLLSSEIKQSEANEELMSADQEKYKTTEELLSAELKEYKANETRLAAVAMEFKADLEKSKITEEILATELTESKVKEEMFAADLKEGKINEEILMAQLRQSRASEERLSDELNESRVRLENLSSDLERIREHEEMAVANINDYKEREAMLSAELCLYQIYQESHSTEFKQYDINDKSHSNKVEDYKIDEEMLASELKKGKAEEAIVSAELKKSMASNEILSGELKEYNVKDGIQYAGLSQSETSENLLSKDKEKCKAQENVRSAELKKFKSSEERLSLELDQRKVSESLHSGEIDQLQNYSANDPEKDKSATSQGLVQEAGNCQPKSSCQALGEMSEPPSSEEVSVSSTSQAHSKLGHLQQLQLASSIIEQFEKRITAQSVEILQYRDKIELLLYKNLLSVSQNQDGEDSTETGVKEESLESTVAKADMARKGKHTTDIVFDQLRKEQEFREELFELHEMKNKELFRQIAVLNNLVITSQHQMENISQIWRSPTKQAETDSSKKLLQENKEAVNRYPLSCRWCKFRCGSIDKASIQPDRNTKIKNSDSEVKGHNYAETRIAGKFDHRQSRSADFQKCAIIGRKKDKLSASFNSRVTKNREPYLQKIDFCHKCDHKQGTCLKKIGATSYESCDDKKGTCLKKIGATSYESCDDKKGTCLKKLDTYENCDPKQSQEHLSKSQTVGGAETDQSSSSADDELMSSVEASESCRTHRKGHERPSLSPSSRTGAWNISSIREKSLACKTITHSDKSKFHSPDQLSVPTTSQPPQKECSQPCPTDLVSHMSTSHICKTDKLKPCMPSKLTLKQPQSPSQIAVTTNTTFFNNLVGKVANNLGPQVKGIKAACCSVVQRPLIAPQTDRNPHCKAKKSCTALKQLSKISNNIDSVVEVYPEKIGLDVVTYFSADDQAKDITSKKNHDQNDPDLHQRNENLSNSFPTTSELFSVMTSQFVERLTDGHLEIPDKCNTGIGPKCESRSSSRQFAVLKFPNSQSVESSGNLHTISTTCGSIPENHPNNMSSSASMFSDIVESRSTQKSQNEIYPLPDDSSKSHSRQNLVSKQKSEPVGYKRQWHSSSQFLSLGSISDTANGRRNGLGYACSASLQKKVAATKNDHPQAKLGNKYRNPRHLAPKPLLAKPVRGKEGYAAMAAKQVSWNADGKSQNLRKSTRQIHAMKYFMGDAEMRIKIEENE